MNIDKITATNLSFPISRPEESIFRKPDLTSDKYVPCQPIKSDTFVYTMIEPIKGREEWKNNNQNNPPQKQS